MSLRLLHFRITLCSLALLSCLSGCGAARSAYDFQADNPLGASFWLIATPSEDDTLLGRVFTRPPDASLSLMEQSAPNPCEAELRAMSVAPMQNRYENAIDLSASANGKAVLGAYGFSGAAADASHLLYTITTQKEATRFDTPAYVVCCKTHDCGWGYVSRLVYGRGEYASARHTNVAAATDSVAFSAKGNSSYEVLDQKQIQGWLAATITAHVRSEAARPCAAGEEWHGGECVSRSMIAAMRESCANDASQDPFWKDDPNMQYTLKTQHESACRWLTAHGLQQVGD